MHLTPQTQSQSSSLSLRFVAVARALADAATVVGVICPSYRSPPRVIGLSRTITQREAGDPPVVAVAIRDRPWAAVVADMVEGVVVANDLDGIEADRCRSRLWDRLSQAGEEVAA